MDQVYVSVLIAALNEEAGIGLTLSDLYNVLGNFDCFVIDGNSTDKTASIAQKMGAFVVYQKGRGKGNAILEGMKKINQKTKYLVLVDGDFTYPASYLLEMIKVLELDSDVGMVLGNRFNKILAPHVMKRSLYLGNKFLGLAQYVIAGLKLNDPLSGLRVIRWDLLKEWVPKSKGFDIEVELNLYINNLGYGIHEIPISYRQRRGQKKLRISHGFSILKRIISESYRNYGFAEKVLD